MFACKLNMVLSCIYCSMDKSFGKKLMDSCMLDVYAKSQKKRKRAKESRHKLKIITFHVFITIHFAAVVKLQPEKYEIKIFHFFLLAWRAMMYNGFRNFLSAEL